MSQLEQDFQRIAAFNEVIPQAQEAAVRGVGEEMRETAFRETVTEAQAVVGKIGTVKAMNYDGNSGGNATFTRNHWKVKPLDIELSIDVKNIARRVLTAAEFRYFIQTYFEYKPFHDERGRLLGAGLGIADPSDRSDWTQDGRDRFFEEFIHQYDPSYHGDIRAIDQKIRLALGEAFINGVGLGDADRHRTHPVSVYRSEVYAKPDPALRRKMY